MTTTPSGEPSDALLREYIGYLVSMAAMTDHRHAKHYADTIEEILATPQPASEGVVEIEPTDRHAGFPSGWTVEPMDEPSDRLMVTSATGAEVIVGPKTWQQSITGHVLYELVQTLTATAPQAADPNSPEPHHDHR